ncbi:hypothetical protein NKR23_g4385 [Pleurostoma richardsiae]|uniref:Uncharacterized protein n=1 Tax=Pleurostoma richardsiae TaxID=41990 RepID=A0AA38VVF1_9PEZI|nr:hypothetical protein NKR23_g4385 [Pleurostoma richardsiae]
MDKLKKIIHPDPHPSKLSTTDEPSSSATRPSAETMAQLGSEPNVTGGDRPAPREADAFGQQQGGDYAAAGGDAPQQQQQQPAAAGGELIEEGKVMAEEANNFPGTNPHPAHSALGTGTGDRGLMMPGRG